MGDNKREGELAALALTNRTRLLLAVLPNKRRILISDDIIDAHRHSPTSIMGVDKLAYYHRFEVRDGEFV